MEYRLLRFFIAVAEELSFTRAASRLRIAQPHLSREIRRLESEIGVPLFIRDPRQIALTAAGNAFLARTRHVIEETAEAVSTAQRAHRGETGQIRIGFSSSAGFGLLPDVVRRFRLERPDVELVLAEFNSDEQPDLLRSSLVDVCLLYPPRPPEQELETETLLIEPLVAAVPEDHPLADQDRILLESMANEPWIFFRRAVASRLHDEILRACGEAGFTPRVVQEALKLSTIASLVAGGLGVCLVPVTLTRLRLPRIVCRPLATAVPQVPLAAMWRIGDPNPALSPFLETVRNETGRFLAAGGWARGGGLPGDGPVGDVRGAGRAKRSGRRSRS